MNLVLDTNIVISGLITPKGKISKLIFKDLSNSNLICPSFLFEEVRTKFEKIESITGLTNSQLNELIHRFYKNLELVEDDLIDFKFQKVAYHLVADIDKKDLLFVALSLQTGYPLWTGDKKLLKGLQKKGYKKVLSTDDLVKKLDQK